MQEFRTVERDVDFCVVGGGLAGTFAAIAAARHGAKVALIQERPMLGGNASSEIRMWVGGCGGRDNQETGLLEELYLENLYRNPDRNYSVWDSIIYEMAAYQPGLEVILNCSVNSCEMDGSRIKSVTGWQQTTQTYQRVNAKYFADCSGDSVLAPVSGALFRIGREAKSEFNESIEPDEADRHTMGMSCLLQARQETREYRYTPPKWAHHYTKEDLLPFRVPDMDNPTENFWYIELGGMDDSIADSETVRDELLRIVYGLWDYVKNAPENAEKNKNWRLDWVGMLPGKRESRRYVGDHILTQNDVLAGGRFDDLIAYGGWSMDDHDPRGFATKERHTNCYRVPTPYGIPYRCLYSKNIDNLYFAGRNISVTHAAVSSTRVMATCAILGQAAGTAAAIAVKYGISPRDVYNDRIGELRQMLMDDDCWLPFAERSIPELTRLSVIESEAQGAENLINGVDRPVGGNANNCVLQKGQSVSCVFDGEKQITGIRIVFDSDLNRDTLPSVKGRRFNRSMFHNTAAGIEDGYVPKTLTKEFRIEGIKADGSTEVLIHETQNHQRLYSACVSGSYRAVRFVPVETWGSEAFSIFAFEMR